MVNFSLGIVIAWVILTLFIGMEYIVRFSLLKLKVSSIGLHPNNVGLTLEIIITLC